jgi:hypothetical protein
MPPAVRDAFPAVPWRLELVWELDLPVEWINVGDFADLLDLPLWQRDGKRFQVSPHQVLADPSAFPDHYARVMAADLRYPVHLAHHRGRWTILDGYHRLAKAIAIEHLTIASRKLSAEDLDRVCR